MLRKNGEQLPLGVGMLRLAPEWHHPDRERQPLVHNSEHLGFKLQHLGSKPRPLNLNLEHIGLKELLQPGRMLQNPEVSFLRNLGMMRMEGDSEHFSRRPAPRPEERY